MLSDGGSCGTGGHRWHMGTKHWHTSRRKSDSKRSHGSNCVAVGINGYQHTHPEVPVCATQTETQGKWDRPKVAIVKRNSTQSIPEFAQLEKGTADTVDHVGWGQISECARSRMQRAHTKKSLEWDVRTNMCTCCSGAYDAEPPLKAGPSRRATVESKTCKAGVGSESASATK